MRPISAARLSRLSTRGFPQVWPIAVVFALILHLINFVRQSCLLCGRIQIAPFNCEGRRTLAGGSVLVTSLISFVYHRSTRSTEFSETRAVQLIDSHG